MASKLPPPPPRRLPPKKQEATPSVPAKKFSVGSWGDRVKGEKIIVYGDSGMGKTTLTATAPDPVFMALDDGSSKIKNPITGEPLKYIEGVTSFDDARAVLRDYTLLDPFKSVVIDTGDMLELYGLQWTLDNIKHEKGFPINGVEDYGWGKGYRHWYDTMRLPMGDIDALANQGKNVILICQMMQVTLSNSGGGDYLCDVPSLQPAHGKDGKGTPAIWAYYVQMFDQVWKIGYSDIAAHEGKAASSGERVIYTRGRPNFKAKSRGDALHERPLVTFDEPSDDSIWKFLFGSAE